MSQPLQPKPRYCITNWKQYNAALKARGSPNWAAPQTVAVG